ncbi:MAG: hypothetical protein HQL88_02615 [Magnetococcales bacterium]|nr:hypothetical protein [Magnetococcales bacterium]
MTTVANFGTIPTTQSSTSTDSKKGGAEQLKLDFLKLLTTQLQYQDPLSPTSNADFTSQMAQFSSLDAQNQSNALLQQLLTAQGGSALNQAVAYMGKQVVVPGNQTSVQSGAATVYFELPEAVESVAVNVFDASGALVGETTLQAVPSGENQVRINGINAPNGNYRFTASYTGSDGNARAATTLISRPVTGVVNGGSGVLLDLDGQQVALTEVRRVELASSAR